LYNYILKFLVILLVTACTKNSLFDDEIGTSDGMTLSGTVRLDKDPYPDNIYVWLGILNLGTYTDTDGNFQLHLPHPENQPQKGISGEYTLFYYVSNYKIDSSKVSLLKGKFVYNKSDINKDGHIRETITLNKLLTINASITPIEYPTNHHNYIQVDLFIKNVFDPVLIQIYKHQRDDNMITNIFFIDTEKPLENTLFYRFSSLLREAEIKGEKRYHSLVHTDSIRLETAKYEVIPFIKIIQDNIPDGLMESIGEDQVFVDSTYLTIPFKRQNAFVTVTPE
jgi:hypothetical protein